MSKSCGTPMTSRFGLRVSYIRLIIAGFLLTIAAGSLLIPTKNALQLFSALSTHAQTQSGSANSATVSSPPTSIQRSEPNAVPSAGRPVLIDFSNLPFYTAVTSQYPDAIFSSDSGDYVITTPQNYGTAFPNISRAYLYGFWVDGNPPYNHFAPLVVDFPKPVNDLAFHLLASDDIGVIASVDVYQNNAYTKTEPIFGNGNPFSPIWINLGAAGYKNVTRIVVGRISDRRGLAFDNFSFTVPTATPTPTPSASPTPTPPPAPTNVNARPDEERIVVSWTPSQGAGWYVIKRADAPAPTSAPASNAAAPDSLAFAPINPTFYCDGVSVPCVYEDNDSGAGLSSDTIYSYVVAAVNNSGTSADSNPPATTKPLPKPGCQALTKQRPSSRNVTRHGWNMEINVTDTEGLQLRYVSLNGRLMAESMSVPYYRLSTKTAGRSPGPNLRGQLKPASSDQSLRSRLIGYDVDETNPNKLVVRASYAIDHIPDTPKACVNIVQQYEFYREGFGGRCEPSGVASCSRFRPMVTYNFYGGEGESLTSLNIPQRNHYQVKGAAGNTVGVFLDPDTRIEGLLNLGFPAKMNPVTKEFWSTIIGRVQGAFASGQSPSFRFDNFHQTNQSLVKEPPLSPGIQPELHIIGAGCLECVHNHWRWGAFFGKQWGNGFPLIPLGSNQTVDIGVVRYPGQVNSQQDWLALVNGENLYTTVPQDPVFWFSPTGYLPSDVFFSHYAWFNPHPPASGAVNIESAANPSASTNSQDGPVSVTFGDVYQPGSTNFDAFDLSTLAPLPAGYTPLNNAGYMITTTALVSGPHVINFSAASVTDQATFNNLRIFHPEPDPFDPDRFVWVDKTILSPDTPGPDFSAKLLSAKTEGLGVFVIGNLVQNIPPSTDVANLAVTCSDSSDPITAGNNLTYTINVTNSGPQSANNVGIRNGLSPDAKFVSATSSQGTCKEIDGTVYCNLNFLSVNATATVSLVVQPTEGTGTFPTEGKTIYNGILVKANETDNDLTNNSATESTNLLPNPNNAPNVNITNPMTGALLVGPTNITLNASANDSDGTISKVEFFDNGELIGVGSPTGNNQYVITKQNASFGDHSFLAVATDNGGRQNTSNVANVIVNGSASVSLTSPSAGALYAPDSNISLTANAAHPSGIINKVEFFRNGESLGLGTAIGGNQYNIPWNSVDEGMYSIVAVATDGSGITTTSAPINITVDTPPTVTMNMPLNGSVFPSATNISVSATAQSGRGSVVRVDFYGSGVLIGSASDVGTDQFTLTWRHVPDGFFLLTAVATDNLGVSATSASITIGVNTPSPQAGEFIWFDDALPQGAVTHADDEGWHWVDSNPASFSGTKAHQSRNFGQLDAPNTSFHQHYFDGATTTLPVSSGDKLFTYVFLDINNMPREIMLQWKDANGWEHRAYWGANRINAGADGTNSRRYMGPIPKPGQWVRLEVPANLVGLEGSTLNGMTFTLDAGRATWDLTGKTTANAASPPTTPSGDSVWIDDGLPAGAVTAAINDQWNWVSNPHYSGQGAHQSQTSVSHNTLVYRSHSFTGAQTPMQVNPGDVLFTYVFLDPSAKPDQIMLQWYDGSSWGHRAFWGENFIGRQFGNLGIQGTESQRYMGGVPAAGSWYRLEVPAGFVGLEGKSVSGMAFSIYGKEPTVTWDRSGKAPQVLQGMFPLPLSATSAVWRTVSNSYGYAFETNDLGPDDHGQPKVAFYAHSSLAAGTVPLYRFRRPNIPEYFYAKCKPCYDGNGWLLDVRGDANSNDGGIAFYVYEDGSTTGTAPLYLYHDNQFHYFLTTNQSEAAGMVLDGIAAYTYPNKPDVPVRPYLLPPVAACANLNWSSSSPGVIGYKIERRFDWESTWAQIATVGPGVTYYFASCVSGGSSQSSANPDPESATDPGWSVSFRIRAIGSTGDSDYSNEVSYHSCPTGSLCPDGSEPGSVQPNNPPEVAIITPGDGDVVDHNFVITANAFDVDGNGTIRKAEFFANGNKVGEVADPPYVFSWDNAPLGTYSLMAKVTDNAGVTTTSTPVSITVGLSNQTITFDPIPDKTYGDAPFTISAAASSGLPVTFSVVSGPATISGSTVTITGRGPITVQAAQGGDENYNAAPNVNRSFTVAKASATIALSNLSQTYDGTAKPVTATTDPVGLSGLSITYNGSATVPTNAGSYSIVASLVNDNYTASDASGTLTIGKAAQTITFNPLENKTYGDASFAVSASSSSGVPVSFSIASGPATVAGSTLTLNGAGTVNVRASQNGNENYSAAPDVDRSFTVAKASATITLTNLNQNYDGAPKTVTATTNPSGLNGISIKYDGSSTAPSNAGSYSVVASLTNDNYTATDATGTLNINAPPTVSITNPTSGALVHATSITINASASDSDGSVSKVEFFQGSVKLGEVISAPFSLTWNNVAGGSYSLTVVATDNLGKSTVSSPVTITVNNPPNIIMTASSPQDVPTAPAQITINAEASDADGTINKVDFYQGTTLLATVVTSPYSYTWSNVAAGNYSITTRATDNLGGMTTSNLVGISVNAKPNVSLTSPGNGATFIAPALVSIGATASDSDGSISKVEFYQGSTLISTVTASPYSFNWSYVPAGTYTLTAKASDNIGASTTSNTVSITVTSNSVAIGKIAFTSNRDGCAQIYLMNTDGTGQSCLSNGAANDESPKWSPDNSRIVFQSDRDFQSDGDEPIYGMDIYVMNWDGSAPTRLTYATYDDIAPVWSPDGTKIAFQSFRNGVNSQIYVMNADGSGQANFSNSTANDTQPAWSPDGSKIAFASDRDQPGFPSVYVMNVNGSNQTRLTSSGTGLLDQQPAWSPDGMKLAFISTRDSTVVTWDEWDSLGNLVVKTKLLINKEVYVMNADGSSQVRLTNIMGNDDSPAWSPDGTKIVFRSDRDRNCCDPYEQVWVMNADGSNQVNLSNNSSGDYGPSWSR